MFDVQVSENLRLDGEDFKDEGLRVGILAMSGVGKSNLAALFVEAALDAGWQVVIIEPISEWHTLKSMYPQVVVAGGEFKDVELTPDPEAVKLLVDLLESSRASLVLNVSDIEDEVEQKRVVASFLWHLYLRWQRVRRPLLLVLEEADVWAPQQWTKEDRPCMTRVALLAKHGRKLGINLILISQRPSDIHKSPLSQCNVLFFGKFKSPQDLSPRHGVMFLAKKLEIPITEAEISSLDKGEFYAWVKSQVVKIRAFWRKTPHGGETPSFKPLPVAKEVEKPLKEVSERLRELVAKRKRELSEVERLRRENEALRKQVAELEEKIKVLKAVKEVPLEVKAKPVEVPIKVPVVSGSGRNSRSVIPELPPAVTRCPHTGAFEVYEFLRERRSWLRPGEIALATGLSMQKLRKVLMYFRRKGLVRMRFTSRSGKLYIKEVSLK